MRVVDFEWLGKKLSDYGYIIGSLDKSRNNQEIGNDLSYSKDKVPNADYLCSAGLTFDGAYDIEFGIMPNPCGHPENDGMTYEEINEMMYWLNQRGFYKLTLIYDENVEEKVYYYGTFTAELNKVGSTVTGLQLEFQSNYPYGLVLVEEEYDIEANTPITIESKSLQVGHVYLDATVTCNSAGDLEITNDLDENNLVRVKNCLSGEELKLNGKNKIITSSLTHKRLYNDFNTNFMRICNVLNSDGTVNITNSFTSNLDINLKVSYEAVRKVGIIL